MLVHINKNVLKDDKNAEAALKLAEWARTADYNSAVKAYADCHRDPNIDDSFIRTLAQCDRFYLGVFICNRHDMLHPWIYERCREVEFKKDNHLDLWARFHYKSPSKNCLRCASGKDASII